MATHQKKFLITIDWDRVDKLLEIQCSGLMIAASLGISEETLYTRVRLEKNMVWSDYAAKGKSVGRKKLLNRQFERALKGKGADKVLIHLGEHYIDEQKRVPETIAAGTINNVYLNDCPFDADKSN